MRARGARDLASRSNGPGCRVIHAAATADVSSTGASSASSMRRASRSMSWCGLLRAPRRGRSPPRRRGRGTEFARDSGSERAPLVLNPRDVGPLLAATAHAEPASGREQGPASVRPAQSRGLLYRQSRAMPTLSRIARKGGLRRLLCLGQAVAIVAAGLVPTLDETQSSTHAERAPASEADRARPPHRSDRSGHAPSKTRDQNLRRSWTFGRQARTLPAEGLDLRADSAGRSPSLLC
jgi:hypothetical protein